MKFFGRKKDKNKSHMPENADISKVAKDDGDEVELACRDLMLASLENMRKEVIPGKRDVPEDISLEQKYQEIADFINQKVDVLESELPDMNLPVESEPTANQSEELNTSETEEKIEPEADEDKCPEQEESAPEKVDDNIDQSLIKNIEPIEQEFSLSPNKQLIIDQITANDIDSAVSFKGKKPNV